MSNPFISQMISAGDLSFALTHPLINGGTSVSLVGFKIEGTPVDSDQEMDNAKVVPLVGGVADVYTNTVRAVRFGWLERALPTISHTVISWRSASTSRR